MLQKPKLGGEVGRGCGKEKKALAQRAHPMSQNPFKKGSATKGATLGDGGGEDTVTTSFQSVGGSKEKHIFNFLQLTRERMVTGGGAGRGGKDEAQHSGGHLRGKGKIEESALSTRKKHLTGSDVSNPAKEKEKGKTDPKVYAFEDGRADGAKQEKGRVNRVTSTYFKLQRARKQRALAGKEEGSHLSPTRVTGPGKEGKAEQQHTFKGKAGKKALL